MKYPTNFSRLLPVALTALTLAAACNPKKDETPAPTVTVTNSVYVVNEGYANGAVSLFDKATKRVQLDRFADANSGRKLGAILQSMTVVGENAYLVGNGANAIQVVKLADFTALGTITGLSQPRYLVAASVDKAYLTEWVGAFPNYSGRVSVIDLKTNAVTKQITVGSAPDEMLLVDGKLYVTATYGSALTVINTSTDAVESTIPMPDGPKNILRDGSGNIWVLCSKYNAGSTPTTDYLVRFAPGSTTAAQQTRIAFPNSYANGNLRTNADGSKIYVSLGSGTYALDKAAAALPATPLIRRSFYGLGIDPQDNTIYGGTGFTGSDKVIRYTLAGAPIDSFNVVTSPNGFVFR
jgi:YVTN family beta-propeller protein